MAKLPNDLIEVTWDKLPDDLVEVGLPDDLVEVGEPRRFTPEKVSAGVMGVAGKMKDYALDPRKIMQDYLGGEKKKRDVIKEYMSAKPERPYALNVASEFGKEFVDYASPEWAIAGGLAGGAASAGIEKLLKTPQGMKLAQKYLPNLLKGKIDPIQYEKWLKQKSPTGYGVSQAQRQAVDPVFKITEALKSAKPIRKEQEALYTAERMKRVAQLEQAGAVGGEAGYVEQLKKLKGEMPKVQFEGIRGKVTQPDIDSLFNRIDANAALQPLEKITTKSGLAKLLGEQGGAVPTKGELNLLGQVFPNEFIQTILTKRPFLQKVGEGFAEVLNVPRALMASFDLSMPFRQGLFLIRRQKQFAPAFRDQFKYFFSEKAYQGLTKSIEKRPSYPLMRKAGLQITKVGGALTQREEEFMGGKLAEKIPFGIGKIVKMSNRAATGFLNKMRADVFDDLVKKAQRLKLNVNVEGPKIATYINTATGRGNLGMFENAAVALNSVFFSPRLMASRVSLMNPVFYAKLSPMVRKEALKDLLGLAGVATTTLGLAKMGGAEIGYDPRSADFGKIKIGNTRYDIGGGFLQYMRLGAQLITGEHVSSTTGVKTTVGEGYKPMTRAEILGRFIGTKESPVASFAMGLLKGKGFAGKKFEVGKEAGLRFVSMVVQDMYDLYEERGLEGLLMASPAIFGIGVQTYAPNAEEIVRAKNSVMTEAKKMFSQGRAKEGKNLLDKNEDIIKRGVKLEPHQKLLNVLRKQKEKIEENVLIEATQKKYLIKNLDAQIKKREDAIVEKYKDIKKEEELPSDLIEVGEKLPDDLVEVK